MTENRAPRGVVVNGAFLFVKTAAGEANLFQNWQRVTGLSSFTLPAEVGGTTETQLMDGVIAAAAIAGVGTITGAIGGRGVHVSQLYMEERKLDGGAVAISILKAAVIRSGISMGGESHTLVDTGAKSIIEIPSSHRAAVLANVRAGDLVALGAQVASQTLADSAATPANFLDWKADPADAGWRGVVAVASDGAYIHVAPDFDASSALSIANNQYRRLFIRTPGVKWVDLIGTVNGFDSGDFQNGQQLAGNFSFAPNDALTRVTPEFRALSQLAGLYQKGVGYQGL